MLQSSPAPRGGAPVRPAWAPSPEHKVQGSKTRPAGQTPTRIPPRDAGPGPPPPRPGPRSRAFQDGRAGCHLGLPGNSAAASPRARAVTNAAPPSRAMDTTRLPVSGTRGLPRERRGTLTRSQGLEPPDHGGDTRHPPRTPPPPPGRPSRSLPGEAVTREDSLSWALPGAPAPQARGTPSLPRTRPCSSQPPSAAPRTPQPPRRLPSVTARPRPRGRSPRLAVHRDEGGARGPTAARPAGMGSSDARRGSGCSMSPSFTGAPTPPGSGSGCTGRKWVFEEATKGTCGHGRWP